MSQAEQHPETTYEYVSGYCRALNSHRIVECTFFRHPDGYRTLEDMDCDFGQCPNHIGCAVAKAAREME